MTLAATPSGSCDIARISQGSSSLATAGLEDAIPLGLSDFPTRNFNCRISFVEHNFGYEIPAEAKILTTTPYHYGTTC
jgi:hypothetical protein